MSQSQPPVAPPGGLSREELRSIAARQKGILVCVLIYLVGIVLFFILPPAMRPVLWIVMLANGVVAAVFIFMLATRIYSTGVGVLLGILTLICPVGFIVLLIMNAKANGILKKNGIKVGFFGARLSKI